MSDNWDDSTLQKYLLGMLPEQDAAALEDAYMADDEIFERVSSVERELIHTFLRGTLRDPLLTKFSEVYESHPVRNRRLRAEQMFWEAAQHVKPAQTAVVDRLLAWLTGTPQRRSALVIVTALGLIAAALFPTLLWQRANRLQGEVNRLQAAADAERRPEPVVVAFAIHGGLSRSASAPQRIRVAQGVDTVRLRLESADGAPAGREYRAVLRTADQVQVWSGTARADGSQAVLADIPRSAMSKDDYVLSLESRSDDKSAPASAVYFFGVVE